MKRTRGHSYRSTVLAIVGTVVLGGVHGAGCGGDTARLSVLPDASYDAFDLAKERDAGPPCIFDNTPHKLGAVYAPIFRMFAVGKSLHWFVVEDPIYDDSGSIGSWRAKNEGGPERFEPGIGKGHVALWVDRNGVYSSRGTSVSSLEVPRGQILRAMIADDTHIYALLASSGCQDMGCDSPLGHQLATAALGAAEATWNVVDSSADRLPPSPWKGDLAQDDKTIFFILRSPDGRAEIRAIDKAGGGARSILASGISDAGTGSCKPPDVCIDGDLRAHRGNAYWLSGGSVFVASSSGGPPSTVVAIAPSRVTWFTIDDDFLYTNELAVSGKVDLVRRSLSNGSAPKVLFTHQLVRPQNPYKVGAIAVGPHEIYTLVETEGSETRRELIGLCKE